MQHEHPIHIFINKKRYEIDNPVQTGAGLKNLAGIPLNDVLFLQRPGEDEVIPNDKKITLKNGDHLHSQPPADYGLEAVVLANVGIPPERVVLHPEASGWQLLVISDFELPVGFQPNRVKLLVKLPPGFPDAAPDMFWVHPAVRTGAGNADARRHRPMPREMALHWWHGFVGPEIGEKGRTFAIFATRTGPEKSERRNTLLPNCRFSPAPTSVVRFHHRKRRMLSDHNSNTTRKPTGLPASNRRRIRHCPFTGCNSIADLGSGTERSHSRLINMIQSRILNRLHFVGLYNPQAIFAHWTRQYF